MCLEDEYCDAFEYKTEVRSEVSSCSLMQLQNSIMMEYSFNMRHTGSVDKIGPIYKVLYTELYVELYFERIKLESKNLGGAELCQFPMKSTPLV